jgi:hypothetical protein
MEFRPSLIQDMETRTLLNARWALLINTPKSNTFLEEVTTKPSLKAEQEGVGLEKEDGAEKQDWLGMGVARGWLQVARCVLGREGGGNRR